MNAESKTPAGENPKRSRRWPWLVPVAVLGLAVWILVSTQSNPSFQGRSIGTWFDEAVASYEQSPNEADTPSFRAFREMEGDAVPFLVWWLDAKPTRIDKAYAGLFKRLPASLSRSLPQPRDDGYYSRRRSTSIELLRWIGAEQRWKAEAGRPSTKPSIALAVPGLRVALHSGYEAVAGTLDWIGSPAAPAVPDLIEVAQGTNMWAGIAMQALGRIGPAASNAVEVLTEIATSDHQSRLTAVTALGLLRGAARPAAPALVPLLRDEDEQIRINSARALVHIGLTPDKAVPALKRMLLDTNEWTRMVATMGLWNHDRSDTNLQAAISSWLRSPDRNRSPVVFSLGCLGTNAAPFLPEIESSFGDPDPNVRRFAAQAVRRIRDGEP